MNLILLIKIKISVRMYIFFFFLSCSAKENWLKGAGFKEDYELEKLQTSSE